MKIQGLKSEDFEHIERAFGYTIGEQIQKAERGYKTERIKETLGCE